MLQTALASCLSLSLSLSYALAVPAHKVFVLLASVVAWCTWSQYRSNLLLDQSGLHANHYSRGNKPNGFMSMFLKQQTKCLWIDKVIKLCNVSKTLIKNPVFWQSYNCFLGGVLGLQLEPSAYNQLCQKHLIRALCLQWEFFEPSLFTTSLFGFVCLPLEVLVEFLGAGYVWKGTHVPKGAKRWLSEETGVRRGGRGGEGRKGGRGGGREYLRQGMAKQMQNCHFPCSFFCSGYGLGKVGVIRSSDLH